MYIYHISQPLFLEITMKSNEDHVIGGRLTIDRTQDVEITHILHDQLVPLNNIDGIRVPEILPNNSYSITVFLKCEKSGINKLQVRVSYGTTLYSQLERSTSFEVPCQYPFDAHFHFMATRQSESKVLRDEQKEVILSENEMMFRLLPAQRVSFYQKIISNQCQNISISDPLAKDRSIQSGFTYLDGFGVFQAVALQTSLKCTTPYPVVLEHVSVENSDKFTCLSQPDFSSFLYSTSSKQYLEDKDEHSSCFVIVPQDVGKSLPVGNLKIVVQRGQAVNTDEMDAELVEKLKLTSIEYYSPLPSITVIDPGFTVSFCAPFETIMGTAVKCSLIIENNTPQVQPLQLFVSESNSFFYAGTTNLRFSILPYQSRELLYSFIPITTGLLEFPKFSLGSLKKQVHILNDDEKWTIYVHEQQKNED